MKRIIAGVAVLGGLVLASYYSMGVLTEHSLHRVMQDIHTTKGIELDIKQYNRGFFTSTAKLSWVVHLAARQLPSQNGQQPIILPERDYVIPIDLSIYHGPFIFTRSGFHAGLGYASGDVNLPEQYNEKLKTFFNTIDKLPALKLGLLINFLNQADLHIDMPKFQLEAITNKTKITWNGLNSQTSLALNLNSMSGAAQSDGFKVNNDDTEFTVGKLNSDYEFKRTEMGLYDGTAHFSLDSLNLISHNKTTFLLKKLTISSVSAVKDGLFDSELNASLDKMHWEDANYGPAEIALSLKNLDAVVLARINQQLQDIQKQNVMGKQKGYLSILPELPRLVGKGASFAISGFRIKMPQGMVYGDMNLSLPSETLSNPFQLISKAKGAGHLNVPVAIVIDFMTTAVREKLQQHPAAVATQDPNATTSVPVVPTGVALEEQVKNLTAQRIASLVQSGVIVKEGDAYTVAVTLDQGAIQINGKAFTPAMLDF